LVVPHESYVWEAKSAKYKKIRVESQEEFESKLPEEVYVISGFPQVREGCGVEYIELRLENEKKECEYIVCTDGHLYIMNDQGKTIDSVNCALIIS